MTELGDSKEVAMPGLSKIRHQTGREDLLTSSSSYTSKGNEEGVADSVESSGAPSMQLHPSEESMPVVPPVSSVAKDSDDSYTVLLPSSWMATGHPPPGDCALLIQIEPEDAARLDFEGVSGAMGRLEAGKNGVVLDLKGHQYQASLLPGPTCVLLGLSKGSTLKMEGVTDEFAPIVQTQDIMAKLDAIVTGAQLDEGYQVVDDNVNRMERAKDDTRTNGGQLQAKLPNTPRKRGPPSTKNGTPRPVIKRKKKAN